MPRRPLYLAGPDLPSVQLSIFLDEERQAASLVVQVLLNLRGQATDEDNGEFLYGLIAPRSVALLCHDPAHHLPEDVSPVMDGPSTTCLRLVLNDPIQILYPGDVALPLRANRRSQQLLSSLESFAKQTVFAVHVEPHHISSAATLQHLCEIFTKGFFQEARHSWQYNYGPRGVRVLNGLAFGSGNEDERARDGGPEEDERTSMFPPNATDENAQHSVCTLNNCMECFERRASYIVRQTKRKSAQDANVGKEELTDDLAMPSRSRTRSRRS